LTGDFCFFQVFLDGFRDLKSLVQLYLYTYGLLAATEA
jgi:hypothetical protein